MRASASAPLVRSPAMTGDDGGGFPVPGWRRDAAALTAWGPAVAASHAGRGSGLVQEHEAIWIEVRLVGKPSLARRSYVLPLLLSRVQRPFLRLMR